MNGIILRLQWCSGYTQTLRRLINSKSVLAASSVPHYSSTSKSTNTFCRSCVWLKKQSDRGLSTSTIICNVGGNQNSSNAQSHDDGSTQDKTAKQSSVPVPQRLAFVAVALAVWAGLYFYASNKKDEKRIVEREEQLSKIDIGAEDYNLTDHTGKRVTKKDFLGQWLLLYFGFTHCPDICPEELEKMAEIIDIVDADKSVPNLLPIFVTVDPDRDTPEAVKNYVKEFHQKFVGLTGSKEEIKQAAKAFRVYFSNGPKDDDNDYIVDHSIVMYLMSPQGKFVDYYGSRSVPTQDIVSGITRNMKNYMRLHG